MNEIILTIENKTHSTIKIENTWDSNAPDLLTDVEFGNCLKRDDHSQVIHSKTLQQLLSSTRNFQGTLRCTFIFNNNYFS